MDINKDILMEAGTNELEILVFQIDDEYYGINVAKVREVIHLPVLTQPPGRHPYVIGIFSLRGIMIPVVNVRLWIGLADRELDKKDRVIVTEFNKVWFGFLVNKVDRIYRVSWEQITAPPDEIGAASFVTSVAHIDDRLILMLDFEKVVHDISPSEELMAKIEKGEGSFERENCRILAAEDSSMMRELLTNTLHSAGYDNIDMCPDGAEAWKTLEKCAKELQPGESIFDRYNLVISDIEMPQMDGLHLTKAIKSHDILKELPVVIFSSLISHENKIKCESVGANAQVTKPEIAKLVGLIDTLIEQQFVQEGE